MEDEKTIEINQETQPIAYAQQTRADRLREASSAPDFTMPAIRPVDDFFSESVMEMDDYMLKDIMRQTGITASTSEQVSTSISNALIGMNQLKDEIKITYGNLANYFTGGRIGNEIAQVAYESITQRYNEMANTEEAIGGIRSELVKLAGGATSFTQLALEGIATRGFLPLVHIGIQEFGQGTYNDMKAYADKHDGSLKGYKPEGFDLAVNFANSLLQVGIESKLGVGSPRFLQGASRGLWKEGLSGALQEGVQGALSDLAEAVKGNQDISILLDNAEDYLRDAIVGGILQGSLGAVTYHQNYARAVDNTAKAIAKAHGHEEPTAQENQIAKAIIDAKEREEASILTQEFKAAFDASTGEGQLQKKIATELKRAVENKELDLDTANETEMAQRIEQIATQETLNAMDYAREQNRAISDMELNNIVYKDGAIWLEGLTPEVGDKTVSYARVLAERQSGLAEVNTKLDAINREIITLKADLAEAKAQKQESRAQVLQARIDKQNAIAEKNRLRAQKLEAQTAKLEKQIAKQTEQVKIAEPVKTEKVSAEEVKPVEAPKREELARIEPKPVVRTSLKKERVIKKTQTGITRKLDADSKFVKVIDKPSNVDFSDGKEYEDSSKRYLLNKVVIKEQDGNLYFKLTGGRYTPTSYVVIEDYTKTDPYEIFSAQVEEGKEIGDHFDRAVQDFYKEKGLWSLAEPVKLRSWEEYMKDSGQVTQQVDEASLEQYDPSKQYNKYDMVRVRTQSGEHIGVWDGERMTLHETMEDAQDFIKNDTEREEADRQADERRATAKKEESEKQEKAFREGQGFVEMPYIIQLLKDNDMWESLSLREKGNFNAIGSVMFSNGRIVNAFGNENSKKGTKVTQNTLDTIQKLRDKLHQAKSDKSLDFSEVTAINEEGNKQKTIDGITIEEVDVRGSLQDVATKAQYGIESKSGNWSMFTINYRLGVITMQPDLDYFPFDFNLLEYENSGKDFAHWAADKIDEFRNEQKGKDEFEFANAYAKEHSFKKATENNPIYEKGKDQLFQGSISGKGDTARGEAEKSKKTTPSVDDEGLLHQAKPVKEYTGETINVDGKERTVYNSNDERIATTEEALTNFWRWFGDSKVVDEQGRPLVVYHGSDVSGIEIFDNQANQTKQRQIGAEKGYFFTDSKKVAERFRTPEQRKAESKYYAENTIREPVTEEKYDAQGRYLGSVHYTKTTLPESKNFGLYSVYLKAESVNEYSGEDIGVGEERATALESAKQSGKDGVIIYKADTGAGIANEYIVFDSTQIKSVDNRGTFSSDTGNILKQGSISGKGDTNRGGYDEQLKRIILGEKSDLSTIQHEFAHYWIQNNFKWARSGLASQDWLRRWRDVEEWLGIEPQDRLLSKSASEKFAKAYERYILEGKVAPELQWAFEGFQKAYQDIYDDLEKEYFDLEEELAPEVVDWFNRNKEQSPKRLLDADEKKLEKALTLSSGTAVIENVAGTVVMTEPEANGDQKVYMGVKESEIPASDNLLVQADKTTASKLQRSAKNILSDKVEVQQLATLDTQATLQNFKDWIARDRAGAWDAMMNPDTRPIYRTYLYKAFAEEALNDVDLAIELANVNMAESVRELGQAIQALDIRNISGFDTLEIIRNIEKSKGTISSEELNKEVESIGLNMVELSQDEIDEVDFDTECKL